MEAQLAEPAAAPDPVTGDGVDDEADGRRVEAVGAELGALCHGAGNDGGGGGAEHSLEHHVDPQRQAAEIVAALDERIKTADEGAGARKHHTEADQPVAGRADTEVHHILHQNIAGILGTGQARFAKGEACLHEEDHERRNQCPCNVCRVVHTHNPFHYPTNRKKRRTEFSLSGAFAVCFVAFMLAHPMRPVKRKLPLLPFFGALPVRRRRFSTVFGQHDEGKLYFLLHPRPVLRFGSIPGLFS